MVFIAEKVDRQKLFHSSENTNNYGCHGNRHVALSTSVVFFLFEARALKVTLQYCASPLRMISHVISARIRKWRLFLYGWASA